MAKEVKGESQDHLEYLDLLVLQDQVEHRACRVRREHLVVRVRRVTKDGQACQVSREHLDQLV